MLFFRQSSCAASHDKGFSDTNTPRHVLLNRSQPSSQSKTQGIKISHRKCLIGQMETHLRRLFQMFGPNTVELRYEYSEKRNEVYIIMSL